VQALSIRQPWATLLVTQRKTIEIRTWFPYYRGDILLHTGRTIDATGVTLFPDVPTTPTGAIIGIGQLVGAKDYLSAQAFEEDAPLHLNPPEWYRPGLVGWLFENVQLIVPIRRPGEPGLYETGLSREEIQITS
jgi:hypothetical protein